MIKYHYPPAPGRASRNFNLYSPNKWWMETKMNGDRWEIIRQENGRLEIWNNQGTPYYNPPTSIVSLLEEFLPPNSIIEGEYIPPGKGPQCIYLFDVICLNGNDIQLSPLSERRQCLKSLIDIFNNNLIKIMPVVTENFEENYIRWKEQGGIEGVVFKRKDSIYVKGGRVKSKIMNWVKYRYEWDKR